MKSRIIFLFSCFLLLWTTLLMRGMFLQIFPDGRLENLKRKQFETSLQIRTRRGAIVDRNGKELAASVPAYSLFADPKMLRDPIVLITRLSKLLDIPKSTLRRRLLGDRTRRFIWIRRQLSEAQRDEIKKWGEPGVGFIEEPRRVYPNGPLLSQVLGFVGSEGEGLEGLELQFDKSLKGHLKTVILPRDARGRPLLEDGRSLTEVPDGADLELTIDHEIQFSLESQLASVVDRFEADAAVGLVLDAQTSEILALANSSVTKRNHVVTDAFEPGSTMKTFVVAAGLRENLLKPSTKYNCENGRWKVGDRWINEADEHHKFGTITATEILAYSSNIGSAKIAFDVGEEKLYKTLIDFGFAAKLGIELPGEARGILNPLPWRPHLFSNIAFGHGISVTPLQLAAAYGAIANGGILKRPLLVRSIRKPGEEERQVFQAEELRRVLTPGEAATMRLMLNAATEEKATGFNARINGFFVAGKTGTAQKVDTKKGGYIKNAYVSSFAGFVPAHDPRYVIFVAVDNPRKAYYGSQVAAPIFAKMGQYLVRRAQLAPAQISESHVISSEVEQSRTKLQFQALNEIRRLQTAEADAASGDRTFPDLSGLTVREAVNRIRDNVNRIDIRGQGVVVKTVPAAGSDFSKKRSVRLILDNL
jgi:cell division protein FtsI (penicillin-binding protein 3)